MTHTYYSKQKSRRNKSNTSGCTEAHVQDTSSMYTARKIGASPRAVVLFESFLVWLCVQNVAASSALDCETHSNIGGVKGSEFESSRGGRCGRGTYLRWKVAGASRPMGWHPAEMQSVRSSWDSWRWRWGAGGPEHQRTCSLEPLPFQWHNPKRAGSVLSTRG